PPGQERILVTLHRARTHRVLVVRQEMQSDVLSAVGVANGTLGTTKKGTGHVVTLPAYKNDVMNALVMSGGLPGLDAQNVVYVIRGRRVPVVPAGPRLVRGQSPGVVPGAPSGYAPAPTQFSAATSNAPRQLAAAADRSAGTALSSAVSNATRSTRRGEHRYPAEPAETRMAPDAERSAAWSRARAD
ncbi:MAG: hypothetical protein ACYTGL_21065, partial [Planctomycetota bacterium]